MPSFLDVVRITVARAEHNGAGLHLQLLLIEIDREVVNRAKRHAEQRQKKMEEFRTKNQKRQMKSYSRSTVSCNSSLPRVLPLKPRATYPSLDQASFRFS